MNRYQNHVNQVPFLRSEWRTWVTRVLLTRWSGVPGEKLVVSELEKKFLAFCGTRSFITVFTKARQVNPIQVLTNQAHTLPIKHTPSQSSTHPPNQAHTLPIRHTPSQSSTHPPMLFLTHPLQYTAATNATASFAWGGFG
jgi:hypothetical protein